MEVSEDKMELISGVCKSQLEDGFCFERAVVNGHAASGWFGKNSLRCIHQNYQNLFPKHHHQWEPFKP